MPTFAYIARDLKGERVVGELAAASEQAVLAELESRRLTPVSLECREAPKKSGRRVSARALGTAYIQVAELLHAGVPLLRSLRLLGGRKSNPRLSSMFKEIGEAVAEGSDLGAAMEARDGAFPRVHVAMVRAGEKGGFLEQVLMRLGQLTLAQAEMRSKVIGNLIYPGVLIVFGTIILGVVFGVFVPMFAPMFETIPGGVPWITKVVFAVSAAVGKYGPLTALGLGIAGVVLWRYSKRREVRRKIERWRTFAPVIGPLTRAMATARFCRMLGTMLANGVPVLQAMQISRDAAGNGVLEDAIEKASESVRAGQPLAPPLAESGLFDDDVVEMISVGEAANTLDTVLVKIADTIESRIDRLLGAAVRLIEPLLLLVLAGAVVIVAVALILPMTQLRPNM